MRKPFTKAGPGRPKGAPNKLTTEVKAVIVEVATGLGGAAGMKRWVEKDPKNEAAFWTSIYPRIAPLDVAHSGEIKSSIVQVELPKKGS